MGVLQSFQPNRTRHLYPVDNRVMRSLLAVVILLSLCVPVVAQDSAYQEGVHYRVLDQQLPRTARDPDKVEVLEFFWYGCPHCYRLEPQIEAWLENGIPDNAEYVRAAAVLNPGWATHARAFYVAESLGVTDKMHYALFDAIHQDGKRLDTREDLEAIFVEHGVDAEQFNKAYDSFQVKSALKKSAYLGQRSGVRAVPSIIVAGKYETSASMADGVDNLFQVINYLVDLESDSQP